MKRRDGFTLVEVITALAVIALLMGLLLPTLASATQAGRASNCLSNLRQMTLAAAAYVNIYQVHPTALRYELRDGTLVQAAWDWETTYGGELLGPGALWAFTDHPDRVCQCPNHHVQPTQGDPFTGYNYNTTYIGAEGAFGAPGWTHMRWGVRPAQQRRPDTTALFGDGGYAGGSNKFMRAPSNAVEHNINTVYSGGQAFRHQQATNVAYIDGHVAAVVQPRRGVHATAALLDSFMRYPDNGFLSDDDRAYDPR